MAKLHDLGVAEAAKAIRTGDIKAEALADALLARAAAHKSLNAFITLEPDKVRAAAREADQRRASGASIGPLHGVPLALKDNLDTIDYPTTGGTPGLAGNRPKRNAVIVQALLDAGAIALGKCNLHELAYGITNNNAAFGPARNPYAPDRIPGASSGGTGVAVAARLAPGGIGSDTGGSVRIPAALCGLAGLRPTTGRWSQTGIVPISHTRDTAGPMTRSVADCVLIDGVVTGGPLEVAQASLKGQRIGVPRRHFWENLDPELGQICENTLKRFTDAGVTLVDVDMSEEAALDGEAGFPIALYETVTDLNQYLKEHGAGFDYAGLVAKCASPGRQGHPAKSDRRRRHSGGRLSEGAAAAGGAAGDLSPSFPRIRRRRHHLSDHAGACGQDRRGRDLHAQRRGGADIPDLHPQYRARQRRRHSRHQLAGGNDQIRLARRHGIVRPARKRSSDARHRRRDRDFVAQAACATGAQLTEERDGFKSNHHRALDLWWSMIFSENRFRLFRIML